MKLEKLFRQTESMPAGPCPLPEPGHGAPVIEEPQLISLKDQPENFNYDLEENEAEQERFQKLVLDAVKNGQITFEDAEKILDSI